MITLCTAALTAYFQSPFSSGQFHFHNDALYYISLMHNTKNNRTATAPVFHNALKLR